MNDSATTTTTDPDSLSRALAAAWTAGRRCWPLLAPVPTSLFTELDATLPEPRP